MIYTSLSPLRLRNALHCSSFSLASLASFPTIVGQHRGCHPSSSRGLRTITTHHPTPITPPKGTAFWLPSKAWLLVFIYRLPTNNQVVEIVLANVIANLLERIKFKEGNIHIAANFDCTYFVTHINCMSSVKGSCNQAF